MERGDSRDPFGTVNGPWERCRERDLNSFVQGPREGKYPMIIRKRKRKRREGERALGVTIPGGATFD
jgi:hypothetical protein